MLDVMWLSGRETGQYVTFRFQVLKFAMQLTYIDVVVSRLVGLHTVLQELNFISLLQGFLFKALVILS